MTFGEECVAAIREYLKVNQTVWARLNGNIVQGIIDDVDGHRQRVEAQASRKPSKEERDALFTALARGCGASVDAMSEAEARKYAVALVGIRKAIPNLAPHIIYQMCERYRKKYPTAAISPKALELHCGELWGELPKAIGAVLSPYAEPEFWQGYADQLYPGSEVSKTAWSELGIAIRMPIVAAMQAQRNQGAA